MIPWTLRDVKRQRWRIAQAHEASFWERPAALPPQLERVMQRYAGLLDKMSQESDLGTSILEVGSGPTCATSVLKQRSVFVDPLMIGYRPLCPDSIQGHFVASLGEELPFRSAVFDSAFSFNAIDHVHSPSRFVSELVRVTRPEGLIGIGVYTHPRLFVLVRTALERLAPPFREAAHPFFFTRESLVKLLLHHKLRLERVEQVYAPKRMPSLHRQDWVVIARKPTDS